MKIPAAIGAVLMLAACATAPGDIPPAPFDDAGYRSMSCPTLMAAEIATSDELTNLSTAQSDKRTGDAIGLLTIGLPISSIGSESIVDRIALTKGRKAAIAALVSEKRCVASEQNGPHQRKTKAPMEAGSVY